MYRRWSAPGDFENSDRSEGDAPVSVLRPVTRANRDFRSKIFAFPAGKSVTNAC